jgi:hypothetical protein
MTLDLYKLLGLIKDAVGIQKPSINSTLGFHISKNMKTFGTANLKKYNGMLKHRLIDLAKKTEMNSTDKKLYKKAFRDIMEVIFKSEGLSGLYDGVDSSADMGERLRYVYNTNKYREVLNLAKELVDYNKLDCSDVISKDPMEFDFKVESGQFTIETQKQILSQRYQTFFKDYVESISKYLESIIKTIMDDLNIVQNMKSTTQTRYQTLNQDLRAQRSIKNSAENAMKTAKNDIATIDNQIMAASNQGNATSIVLLQQRKDRRETDLETYTNTIHRAERQITNIENMLGAFDNYRENIDKASRDINTNVYDSLKDSILGSLASDLTFVYDDGKSFFTDDLIAEGFLKFVESNNDDITQLTGFDNVVKKADTYPEKIKKDSGFEEPNPEFYTAQIVKGLNTTFEVMAEDAIMALKDGIIPAVRKSLARQRSGKNNGGYEKFMDAMLNSLVTQTQANSIFSSGPSNTIKDKLTNEIFKARFLKYVLERFKNYFKMHKITKRIDYDENISQLHPLIQKLIRKGRSCQYFKSFIINYDTCDQLYRLKFITDTKKFLAGILRQPPRKLNNPMHKLQTVIHDYLGLKDNPVWIISKQNVYLSMPDDLSLTNTGILSKISKSELKDVCNIKASDYWNENTMNKATQFGDKRMAKLYQDIKKAREQIDDDYKILRDSSSLKEDKKGAKTRIDKNQRIIDRKEEEIAKFRQEVKNTYKPNAFIFGDNDDDPNKAENQELLTRSEMQELQRNKDKMAEALRKLSPDDDNNFNELMKQQEIMSRNKANYDDDMTRFVPPGLEHLGDDSKTPMDQKEQKKESELDKLLRLREEWANRDNRR